MRNLEEINITEAIFPPGESSESREKELELYRKATQEATEIIGKTATPIERMNKIKDE